MMTDVVFYSIALLMIGSALAVISSRNLFHSVVFLGFSFLGFGMLYILLGADFVGVVQILIYAGAVTMLLMFVIMLTRPAAKTGLEILAKVEDYIRTFNLSKASMLLLVLALFVMLSTLFISTTWKVGEAPPAPGETESVAYIGKLLMSQFVVPFEVASVLILAALIGAIVLGRTDDASMESPADRAADSARRRVRLAEKKKKHGGGNR